MSRKIVCLGGGTGLSTMLRGLKKYTDELTAIVTVADNGGSSGVLRREMNMLPPGDIRNCLVSLAETEPLMQEVFNYRFSDEGCFEGQSFGNLFLAALNSVLGSFELAVEKAGEILAITGRVLPVTMENVQLTALFEDGSITVGETEIVEKCKYIRKNIVKMSLEPARPKANDKAIEALKEADVILLGPGSLYTSVIPNLLVDGIARAIKSSDARIVYISNIMTQPGETDDYTLKEHVDTIEEYLGEGVIQYIIVNDQILDHDTLSLYEEDGAEQVLADHFIRENVQVIRSNLVKIHEKEGYIRHNPDALAKVIMNL